MARTIEHTYRDPLDRVWIEMARRVGLTVRRSDEAFASTDGQGALTIATAASLDPDDSLAQMVFHELCHSLVEGGASFELEDWGLAFDPAAGGVREHACLRLQATLLDRYGLRWVLAPTTDFRSFYDQLPTDPMAPRGAPDSILAIAALRRTETEPWHPHLNEALAASAAIASAVAGMLEDGGDSLLARAQPVPKPHPSGQPGGPDIDRQCDQCAWRTPDDDETRKDQAGHCQRVKARVEPDWPACTFYEPPHSCQSCGACCRSAYGSVTIEGDDPFVTRHPDLVVHRESYVEVAREGDRCAALEIAAGEPATYSCNVYDTRPMTCRYYRSGGKHCLTARKRIHLTA